MTELKLQLDSPEMATIIIQVMEELRRAEDNHPVWPTCPVKCAAIVAEEAGELIREANLIDEGKGKYENLKTEAVQTAATALRLLKKFSQRLEETKSTNPDMGICLECSSRIATTDYNGHGHYVCKPCYESLSRHFDEEYR